MKKFIMSAIATVLAVQVAVADDVMSSDATMDMQQQHDLAKTKSQAKKEVTNAPGNVRISLDVVTDFQVVKPTNEKKYAHSKGDTYVNRLYDNSNPPVVVKDPKSAKTEKKDHDGGILGDYGYEYYFGVDAMLNFKIERDVLHNMSVGAALEVASPANSSRVRDYSVGARQKGAYVFIKTPYVNAQLGSMVGAEQVMKIDSSAWAAADGGISGNWVNYANLEGNYADANLKAKRLSADVLRPFYVTPALYSQYVSDDATFSRRHNDDVSLAPKVSVYSNEISGFQMGLSYAPHHSYGSDAKPDAKFSPSYDDVVGVGAKYSQSFEDFTLKAAVSAEMGSAIKEDANTDAKYHDLFAFSVGGVASYNNMITLGGEYGNLGKSGLYKEMFYDVDLSNSPKGPKPVNPDNKHNHYWTVGGAYDTGPVRLSAAYFKSTKNPYSGDSVDDSTLEDFNVAAHYNFSYGSKQAKFAPYVSYHHFTTKERVRTLTSGANTLKTSDDDNKGSLIMFGVKTVF